MKQQHTSYQGVRIYLKMHKMHTSYCASVRKEVHNPMEILSKYSTLLAIQGHKK